MSISGIYALTNQETEGTFNTGIVDIKLQSYQINSENNEIEYNDDNKKFMPGDIISFIPKISNLGQNCYIRIKINYIDENTDFIDYVTGFADEFTKYGDYYYYNKALKSNEIIKIFDTIRIPEQINNEHDEELKIKIVAEAVQEKNFEPDYTSENPWGNVTPTESINNSYEIDANKNNSKIAVKYENDTNNDISVSSNFFEKMKEIMPGDNYIDKIEIKNTEKNEAKYFLKIETNEENSKYVELLKQVNLTITNKNGQVLYNGKLLNTEKILLGTYNLNEYDNIDLKISIPEQLENKYALLNPELSFIFSAEYDNKDTKTSVIENPKTGDYINLAIIIFFISAVGLITVMLFWHREKKK